MKALPKTTDGMIQLISESNVNFYLHLYSTMKNLDLSADIDFIAAEIEKFRTATKRMLSRLNKRGYLSSEGQARTIRAWDGFLNVLRNEVTESEAWRRAKAGHLLNHRPKQKKRYRNAALSVFIFCLYEDIKMAGEIPKPKFISDCFHDWGIGYDDGFLDSTSVSDIYYALNRASIDIILMSYYLATASPEILFPKKYVKEYHGCLDDWVNDPAMYFTVLSSL